MQLSRPRPPQRLISLVSMIDVLLIMLVFFMVTSTYLNLDMIPVARSADDTQTTAMADPATPMIIRLGPDGAAYLRGQITAPDVLAQRVQAHITNAPTTPILILPSPRASTQSLVTLMDHATRAGARNLRILQLAVRP